MYISVIDSGEMKVGIILDISKPKIDIHLSNRHAVIK